jgi:carboxypeptidase D
LYFQAEIEVKGINHRVLTTKLGQFWRLLSPGTYEIVAHAYDFTSSDAITVTVDERSKRHAESIKFELQPQGQPKSGNSDGTSVVDSNHRVDDGFVRLPTFNYHHYDDLKAFMAFYAHTYPNITRLYSVGKSVENRDLWVMEITDNPGIHESLEPGLSH